VGRAAVVAVGLVCVAVGWAVEAGEAKRGHAMVVKNLTKGNVVASRVTVAKTHSTRRKGLLGRKSLDAEEGMLLIPCRSVHTMGMKFAIDVVVLNKAYHVVKVVPDVKPGRMMIRGSGGYSTLELAAGVAEAKRVEAGDRLHVAPAEPAGDKAAEKK